MMEEIRTGEGGGVAGKLAAIGWGLFFIWIGIALWQNLSVGMGLLGVGVITLAMQVARKSSGLALEWFWVVIGVLFVLGGVWEMFEVAISLVPILLVVAGVVLLVSVMGGKRRAGR
ncbi:MAG: hypothetical protein JSV86_14500 [Gemmatimonadota bacterium]|nr:MAG: hypothetical protein JSV86_14500 [Gemmatimonadota bacterium]